MAQTLPGTDGHTKTGTWAWPDGKGGTGGYRSASTRVEVRPRARRAHRPARRVVTYGFVSRDPKAAAASGQAAGPA